MSIDKKLLTAFALGEARGEDIERARAMVERDPEAKKFVEEVKAFSKSAAEGLAKEPVPEGKGPAAIRAEIERRATVAAAGAATGAKKQYWVEALVACTLLVAFIPQSRNAIMGFLQRGFQNSAGTGEGPYEAAMQGPFSGGDSGRGTVSSRKLVPETHEALFSALGELDSRSQVAVEVRRCLVQLPALTEKDVAVPGDVHLTHQYAADKALGGAIQVTVASFSRKMFTWSAGEEYAKGQGYILVRRAMGDQPAVFYFVPEAAHEPACGVQAAIEGVDFSGEDSGEARAALENMAKKIAVGSEIK